MAEEEKQTEQKTEFTEIEKRAQAEGWVPKDEWDGDPDQWRSAKEFVDRGEFFKKIDDQNRTIKQLKTALDEFGKHHAKVREVEYQRALETLKVQKKTALSEGDADAVIDIDEKMALVRDAQKEAARQPAVNIPDPTPVQNPVFDNWLSRNSWYQTNKAMKSYADRLGAEYAGQGLSPVDVLNRVEQDVKKEFAHKFDNPNRKAPGAVEDPGTKGDKKADTFTLSDDERRVMRRFIATIPGYTEEKYIADLKKLIGV